MIKNIKENKHAKHIGRFLFFCLIGGISFLIDWSFFNVFYKFGLGFVISTICSVAISMVFNFSVNRNITFSARGDHMGKQIIKWVVEGLIDLAEDFNRIRIKPRRNYQYSPHEN